MMKDFAIGLLIGILLTSVAAYCYCRACGMILLRTDPGTMPAHYAPQYRGGQ